MCPRDTCVIRARVDKIYAFLESRRPTYAVKNNIVKKKPNENTNKRYYVPTYICLFHHTFPSRCTSCERIIFVILGVCHSKTKNRKNKLSFSPDTADNTTRIRKRWRKSLTEPLSTAEFFFFFYSSTKASSTDKKMIPSEFSRLKIDYKRVCFL